MSPILSQLSEFPSTLFTHSLQVLLCSSFLPMCGFLYMPPEQSFFIKFFATYITPKIGERTSVILSKALEAIRNNHVPAFLS